MNITLSTGIVLSILRRTGKKAIMCLNTKSLLYSLTMFKTEWPVGFTQLARIRPKNGKAWKKEFYTGPELRQKPETCITGGENLGASNGA